ncbi:RNA polymerase sigma factor [Pinibacter aurantiacus]|uniref:Sigma-70 family RNA polymerase sigma factor n=1 Tax=Pinibacter aurantiacus TaxID=2851599 RepID=A0A9E2W4D0_9BACT|nr:sigma-70 family RNA polymerase sigma factor [Pinibacter aurantiacus]MBV4357333.1 sigma-70 family RNA polymerase sigma factor [Pinibacter aurantiacus]
MNKLQSKSTDEQLLALQQGDEKALSYFFDKYYPALVYYGHSITSNKEFAEETAADAILKLWDRRERFFAENSLRSFLYLVVRNASINYIKAEKKEMTAIADYTFIIEEVQANDFELFVQAQTYQQILHAIESLPKRYQRIFQQFYIEGKSYTEIATALDTSINNVRIQKMRALILLRKKLPFTVFIGLAFQVVKSMI